MQHINVDVCVHKKKSVCDFKFLSRHIFKYVKKYMVFNMIYQHGKLKKKARLV